MNLITHDIIEKTKIFWQIKQYSIYHNTISLIISQKVSFQIGRKIRQKLFDLVKENEFTKENIGVLTNTQLVDIGLCMPKINTIHEISKYTKVIIDNDKYLDNIFKIKGIGIWTIKCLKILNLESSNIFLSEDLWIRKRVSELTKSKITLTQKQCDNVIFDLQINKSILTKFLWRITPNGIIALQNNIELTKDHFL
jgi:3-methyladenine DNA glycosylase/8-oxoguanine DNA glycosylase